MANLATTYKYADTLLSRPGCWAYPDMLEIGCEHGPGGDDVAGLNDQESRSHFASWCIISSPLTLSMDVNNATIMDDVWGLVANPEAIEVNQAWFGHPGGPYKTSDDEITIKFGNDRIKVPAFQYLYKPMR